MTIVKAEIIQLTANATADDTSSDDTAHDKNVNLKNVNNKNVNIKNVNDNFNNDQHLSPSKIGGAARNSLFVEGSEFEDGLISPRKRGTVAAFGGADADEIKKALALRRIQTVHRENVFESSRRH